MPELSSGAPPLDDEARRQAVRGAHERVLPLVQAHLRGDGRYFYTAFEYVPFFAVLLDRDGIESLLGIPDVMLIEEESVGDSLLTDSIPQIGADLAHGDGYTGYGQTIAILDSGIKTDHGFFGSRVVSEACYSTSASPQAPICSHGPYSPSTANGSGGPCIFSVDDGCGHGTWVAGAAAGSGSGISGVAKSASLISIQIHSLFSGGTQRRIIHADVVSAVERVYALRNTYSIAAVNVSFRLGDAIETSACDGDFPSLVTAIDLLTGAGIATVAAAGNTPNNAIGLRPPSCIGDVISVGAVKSNDTITSYTHGGDLLDLFAPGGDTSGSGLETSVLNVDCNTGCCDNNCFDTVGGGTSMAAPHVAGALAVIRGEYPSATIGEMTQQLKGYGVSVSYSLFGQGPFVQSRIDVDAAINGPAQPDSVGVTYLNCFGNNNVSWSAVTSGPVTHYELEGSSSGSFSSPTQYYSGTQTSVNVSVSGTTFFRARACHHSFCGAWRVASMVGLYEPTCP